MPDTKITALAAITTVDPAADVLPIVDISDTSMAASGTTKKITSNQILGAGGTATLASATISGDLTVDTSTLKVDSANNRVGIGTASPAYLFDVLATGASTIANSFSVARITGASAVANDLTLVGPNTSQIRIMFSDTDANGVGEVGYDHSSNRMRFVAGGNEQYRIDPLGVFTWLDGAGGTRMTLNSTGLGVGVTPSAWSGGGFVQLQNSRAYAFAGAFGDYISNGYYDGSWKYTTTAAVSRYRQDAGSHQWLTAPSGTAGNAITFTQAMTLDASANLLVGVTSALFNSRLRVKTSSTSASDYGVYVADSADALIFALRNDGLIYTGTKTASPYNNTTGSAANAFIAADGTLGRSTSSLKYKTDITDSTRGLADVLKLRPVTYKSKNGDDTIFGGLIAEEVHAAGLTEFVAYAPDNAPDAIHYSNMVSLLVAAIKELTARVQTLEAK
jgi:hypothetical protein